MSPDRWKQVKELCATVLELEPPRRAAFLDGTRRTDPDLCVEVESLVAAYESKSTFLEEPAAARLSGVGLSFAPPMEGRTVGAYRLVRQLGWGGMGAVYLGARADEAYDKQVAVKLLRPDRLLLPHAGAESDLRRFQLERQTLANLDHPNIARLVDGGATDDGIPYLVLELVQGQRIDAYCDQHILSIADRLELFRTVCLAVHYAHQRLIVHRDLKPGNILVTDNGTPKLLDFGVAKLLDGRDSGDALTRETQRPMTLEYASPEQIRGEPITTATDVFSLGIVLYELLTGRRLFSAPGASPHETARLICEQQTEKPSNVVVRVERQMEPDAATVPLTCEGIAEVRGVTPDRLRRRLSGDLDTIVLKALQKEPRRRYASVQQLADDIRRHLDGLPVSARPDTYSYRASKFVRRHRIGVSLATFVALMLTAATVVTALAAREARRRQMQAQAVTNFLAEMLSSVDPEQARGREVTVSEILDKAAAEIHQKFSDQPLVRAALATTIGNTFAAMAQYPQAEKHLQAALDIRQELLSADDLDLADSLFHLGTVCRAVGRHDRAEALLLEAKRIREAALGENVPAVAQSLHELAALRQSMGQMDQAEALYRESLMIRRREFERKPSDDAAREVAASLNNLGLLHAVRRQFAKAEPLYREALEIRRRTLGDDHPETAQSLTNLGWLLRECKRPQEAEPLLREALAIHRRIHQRPHPALANSVNQIANLLLQEGDSAAAGPLYREALEIFRAVYGEAHPNVAKTQYNLGLTYKALGRYDQAIESFRQAATVWQSVQNPDLRKRADALEHLVALLRAWGTPHQLNDATAEMLTTLREVAEGPNATAADMNDYSYHLLIAEPVELRDPVAALPFARRAAELRNSDPNILDTLAVALAANGEVGAAIEVQRKAVSFGSSLPPEHRVELDIHLAEFLVQGGDLAGAADIFARVGQIERAAKLRQAAAANQK